MLFMMKFFMSFSNEGYASLKLFGVCVKHFQSKNDLISVVKLRELGSFARTFNYPRHLRELERAGLLHVYRLARKNLYRISSKGKKLSYVAECMLLDNGDSG
jgi:hypothetical protein